MICGWGQLLPIARVVGDPSHDEIYWWVKGLLNDPVLECSHLLAPPNATQITCILPTFCLHFDHPTKVKRHKYNIVWKYGMRSTPYWLEYLEHGT